MHFVILTLFWFLIFFSLLYILVIVTMTIGWFRIKEFKGNTVPELPQVSVVIATRNEEKYVALLLTSLRKQDYQKGRFEIVIVNDHSDDATVKLVNECISENKNINIKLIHSKGE